MHSTTFPVTNAATSLEKIAVITPLRYYHLVADPCKNEDVGAEMGELPLPPIVNSPFL